MQASNKDDQPLAELIADHMEAGFLENIIDMFRYDKSLYPLIAELIQDERLRVRIGVTALMEELRKLDKKHISAALQGLLPLISHADPVVRGDTANLIGIIGSESALPYLNKLFDDENENVRIIAKEAAKEIKSDPLQ